MKAFAYSLKSGATNLKLVVGSVGVIRVTNRSGGSLISVLPLFELTDEDADRAVKAAGMKRISGRWGEGEVTLGWVSPVRKPRKRKPKPVLWPCMTSPV